MTFLSFWLYEKVIFKKKNLSEFYCHVCEATSEDNVSVNGIAMSFHNIPYHKA